MRRSLCHWFRRTAMTDRMPMLDSAPEAAAQVSLPTPFEARVQTKPGHYGPQYERAARWVNYGMQIQEVMRCAPASVLEIGIGSGAVAAILRSRGVSVTSVDIDPALCPDVIGSVHELTQCVPPKSFDLVLCAEVLEHLPLGLLPVCCEQLAAAAQRHVVIGLPCVPRPRWGVSVEFRIPGAGPRRVSFGISPLPRWRDGHPEHYWRVDSRPSTLPAVCRVVCESMNIVRILREPTDPLHLVMSCEPRLNRGGQ
jgi:hypothetical protein